MSTFPTFLTDLRCHCVCCTLVTRYQLIFGAEALPKLQHLEGGGNTLRHWFPPSYWPTERLKKFVSPKRRFSPVLSHGVMTWKTTSFECMNIIVYCRMFILGVPHFRLSDCDVSITIEPYRRFSLNFVYGVVFKTLLEKAWISWNWISDSHTLHRGINEFVSLVKSGGRLAGASVMGVNEMTFARVPCKCTIFWEWMVSW